MAFCYAGLLMVAVVFALCLWQALVQWFKGEKAQREYMALAHEEDRRKNGRAIEQLEESSRAYALGCLVAAGIAAAVEIIVGGIVWACGG